MFPVVSRRNGLCLCGLFVLSWPLGPFSSLSLGDIDFVSFLVLLCSLPPRLSCIYRILM